MATKGRPVGIVRSFRRGSLTLILLAAASCGRPGEIVPPPLVIPGPAVARVAPAPEPGQVEFEVPDFARRAQLFGDDGRLVRVTACRRSACGSATVMLGDGFSTVLPASTVGADVTAHLARDTGALRVTLQVPDGEPSGDSAAPPLGLTVTPAPGDGGPYRPYLQVALPGCDRGVGDVRAICQPTSR